MTTSCLTTGETDPCIVVTLDAARQRTEWRICAQAFQEAGFADLEITLSHDADSLSCATESQCRETALAVASSGARIRAVHIVAASRAAAGDGRVTEDDLRQATDQAAWLGADRLLIAPETWEDQEEASDLETIHSDLLRMLLKLRFTAQSRGVRLCLEAPTTRLFRSPLELRRFMDRVNTPWVGVGLLVDRADHEGGAVSWATSLGWRVAAAVMENDDASPESAVIIGRSSGVVICRGLTLARRARQAMIFKSRADR